MSAAGSGVPGPPRGREMAGSGRNALRTIGDAGASTPTVTCGDSALLERRSGAHEERERRRGDAGGRGVRGPAQGFEGSFWRSYGVLAGKLHVSTSTLHRYCNGDAVPNEFAPVERFARVCGASGDELVEVHRRWIIADAARRRPPAGASDAGAGGAAVEGAAEGVEFVKPAPSAGSTGSAGPASPVDSAGPASSASPAPSAEPAGRAVEPAALPSPLRLLLLRSLRRLSMTGATSRTPGTRTSGRTSRPSAAGSARAAGRGRGRVRGGRGSPGVRGCSSRPPGSPRCSCRPPSSPSISSARARRAAAARRTGWRTGAGGSPGRRRGPFRPRRAPR